MFIQSSVVDPGGGQGARAPYFSPFALLRKHVYLNFVRMRTIPGIRSLAVGPPIFQVSGSAIGVVPCRFLHSVSSLSLFFYILHSSMLGYAT